MKIFIDIGHPAHVHYFRNFINLMNKKGHQFYLSARNKEVIHHLLDYYNLSYYDRGKGSQSLFGKFFYIFIADLRLLTKAIKFKPDIFISFASPYAAQVSWILNKHHIVLDDTESATLNHRLYKYFSNVILNPLSFKKKLGNKQIYFDSFMELCYLHPNYFTPDKNILKELKLKEDERFILIRFVSWNANHDFGIKGLNDKNKDEVIRFLLNGGFKIFISSEDDLPEKYINYKLEILPEKLHHVLAFASLYIGEGATTASECVMLGVPAIYINPLRAGTTDEQNSRGLLFQISNGNDLISMINEVLNFEGFKNKFLEGRKKILLEKTDMTAFLVWFIEHYPESSSIMKSNPDYQYNFR
jgi:uncharacterized protein